MKEGGKRKKGRGGGGKVRRGTRNMKKERTGEKEGKRGTRHLV